MHIPGIKVCIPSTPADAKGLLISAIRDDNPVVFLEHKILYGVEGEVGDEATPIELGKGEVKREGTDVTIVATSLMVHSALQAAETLAAQGISAEVVDPRCLVPLDKDIILNSVKKTHALVVAHEAVKTAGAGAEIAAMVAEEALAYALDANGKPYNFGDDIRIVIPATTSKCERFTPSTSYQLDLAEARAWRAEQSARQNAVRMGAHS